MKKRSKIPWPTKDAMAQIYDKYLWGGDTQDFYSGEGSHHPEIVHPYIETIIKFLDAHTTPLTVCDLGCGDFNIGKQLVPHTSNYIAVDIVDDLIERNKRKFNIEHLEFRCLNIAEDELPKADCAIIRQVLQHISNAEILSVVKKLSVYKYIIITEHIPNNHFTPNVDIISGQGIRLKHNSGVDLLKAPFNLEVKAHKVLHEFALNSNKGKIVTVLLQLSL